MKQYIYFNDKEFRFFEAKDKEDARHYVINCCDLSFNPNFLEIRKEINGFSVASSLISLNLKKFFDYAGGGDSLIFFLKRTI